MPNPKRLLSLTLIGICVSVAILVPGLNIKSQETKEKNQEPLAEGVDTSKFPVVDFLEPLPTDPKERAKREAKGRRYNKKYSPSLEHSLSIHRVNHSLPYLAALPVEKSSAIILGKVKDAKAHLSEDKASVYSEFVITIQSVLKNETNQELDTDGLVEVERYGGRVRFPSGKIVVASIDDENMPRVGARYVLFLTGGKDEAFTILTGYELQGGKVFPLDEVSPTHPITQYKLRGESTLLNDLFAALSHSAARLN
jgi:hypothetical protein